MKSLGAFALSEKSQKDGLHPKKKLPKKKGKKTSHYISCPRESKSGHLLKNIEPFLRYSITSCNFSQILTIAKVSSLQYSKRWFL